MMAFTGDEIVRSRRDIGYFVIQPNLAPLSCRFDTAHGGIEDGEFCAFEFPWCEGCPKSLIGKAGGAEDPLKSAIWLGWSNGLVGKTK
jgi:hypothetical protein